MKTDLSKIGKLDRILKKLSGIYSDGQQLSTKDVASIAKLASGIKGDDVTVVEIGSWEGFSTAVIANEIKGNGRLYAIDHYMGTPDLHTGKEAALRDIYSIFRLNMKRLDLWDTVLPMVMSSEDAALIFKDDVIDFIFLDADHSYECVKQDVEMWLPKLKKGGVLCGHDAEYYYSKLSDAKREVVESLMDQDYIKIGEDRPDGRHDGIHPGVVKALSEVLDDKHLLLPTRMWYYKKDV